MSLFLIVGFLVLIIIVAYQRIAVRVWSVLIGVALLILTLWSGFDGVALGFLWFLFAIALALAWPSRYRQQYVTQPLLRRLQGHMPTISLTEKEAIESGDVWWEKELFNGNPHWQKLFAIPKPTLRPEELDFLNHQVEILCGMLDEWQILNQAHDLPPAAWDYLKKERFFGMVIAKEYGGLGFSALAHSCVIVKIATRSINAAVDTMVPNSLGPGELLTHYGTAEQKEYYLPRLARGEEIPCFALTGPEAGSDAGAITDSGIVCYGSYQGKEILGIRLSWDKRYITLAPVATVIGLAFRLYDPKHLLGEQEDIGITLCLIPADHPGVEIGNRHLPMHMAFMNGPTRGHDVFIPLDWIIGGVERRGQGWRMLMECLSIGRSISLPALSTASGKMIYRLTGAYARLRKQFNLPIAQFEGVEDALAEIAGLTYLLEAGRLMTVNAVDLKIKPAIASAIAKYHLTEMSRKVIAHAMDIHAGQGVQVGPRNMLAPAHLSVPVSITVEGANILTRTMIIFGQGAIRCHPYLLTEVNLLSTPESAEQLQQFDKVLFAHIGYFISNLVRTKWSGLTGGYLIFAPVRGPTAHYYRQLTRMSAALAFLADVCMLWFGGQLKRRERISARLGDILSQLYLASAILKYYYDADQPETDIQYVRWCLDKCLHEIQISIDELLENLPNRMVGRMLRWLVFPWGTAYRKPKDQLSHRIVQAMLVPSAFRDRLTQHCYVAKDANNPLQRLEKGLAMVQDIDPIWLKFQRALRAGKIAKYATFTEQVQAAVAANILTITEGQALQEFNELYQEIIRVNEFSFDLRQVVL